MPVHGDDSVSEGATEDLVCFDEALAKEFEIQTEILGPDAGEVKELRIWNRVIRWEQDGFEWEADQRPAEFIISQLDLSKAKAVATYGEKDGSKPKSVKEQDDDIIDVFQWQLHQDGARVKLEDELTFIQESGVAEAMQRQGWRRTRVDS